MLSKEELEEEFEKMRLRRIHLDFANIKHAKKLINNVLDTGYVSSAGPITDEFEQAMAKYLGVSDAVAVNSGTSALHLALLACDVGPGDEVILPVTTFVATANAVSYIGAKPIFVDIDPITWNIDSQKAIEAITPRTMAFICVHLYGNPCDMSYFPRIRIEDAAESLGAKFKGKHTGTLGDLGCFSFNGNKIMTTGGGGLVVSRWLKSLDKIRNLSVQAKNHDGTHNAIGYNYKMPSLNASLGLAQLKNLESFLAKQRRFNEIYRNELAGLVKFQEATPDSEPSWWFTVCLFPPDIDISSLQAELYKHWIPTRRIFRPLTDSKPYQNRNVYPNARYIYNHGLCLPRSTLNTEKDIMYVCKKIKKMI
jgi:perosamine synthetase